ncbi:F0F1 ATP synthase subunit delta [Buchnera aphidicola]|uniref:ATP synthase subunit delta n=1 Tax=Buchnera aphidicola (Lipaphis pseudobrassicae) TaxID=1258543 RepID=A0A4D6Y6I5_9GAMM|nr:F0F1 ATP synthase subunit delta [Buchnera aphidicola]QCI21908.1 F0F1 ATP synthase subunit delta [Buchnera aphidicola (Lipaphis pseudobrassicae)]
MSVADTISRPYAKAIFEIAVHNHSIQKWKEILIFINKIASYPQVKTLLLGSLSPKYLSSVFIKISGDRIDKEAKNLIRLLSENQRFNVLSNILEQFLALEAHYNNILVVELRSAYSLKEQYIIKIQKILEKVFLKKIQFTCKVDCHLIDGIIIKLNDTVLDLSVRNYLEQLSNSLNF